MDVITLAMLNGLKKSGSVGYVDGTNLTVYPKTELTFAKGKADILGAFDADVTKQPIWTEGHLNTVIFDGVAYECESHVGGTVQIGNLNRYKGTGDTGEPFHLGITAQGRLIVTCLEDKENAVASSTHTLEIRDIDETIHPIDPKFLPKGGVGYSEDSSITWDGNTEGRDTIDYQGLPFYKVSDRVLTAEELVRSTFVIVNKDGGETTVTARPDDVYGSDAMGLPAGLFIMYADNHTNNDYVNAGYSAVLVSGKAFDMGGVSIPSDGTYFVVQPIAGFYPNKLSFETVHPIDPKYLPGVCLPVVDVSMEVIAALIEQFETELGATVDLPSNLCDALEYVYSQCLPAVFKMYLGDSIMSAIGTTYVAQTDGIIQVNSDDSSRLQFIRLGGTWVGKIALTGVSE